MTGGSLWPFNDASRRLGELGGVNDAMRTQMVGGGVGGRWAGGVAVRRAGGVAVRRAGGVAVRRAGSVAVRRAGGVAERRVWGVAGRRAGGRLLMDTVLSFRSCPASSILSQEVWSSCISSHPLGNKLPSSAGHTPSSLYCATVSNASSTVA